MKNAQRIQFGQFYHFKGETVPCCIYRLKKTTCSLISVANAFVYYTNSDKSIRYKVARNTWKLARFENMIAFESVKKDKRL